MEKNELISDYFDIVVEISSILKEERVKYEHDPESPFFDPFSIAIHHFLGQILTFMIIFFSQIQTRENGKNQENTSEEKENMKYEIFNELFLKKSKSDTYCFNQEAMHQLLANKIGISSTDLPKLFHEKPYLIPLYQMSVSLNFKKKLYQKLWANTLISDNESSYIDQQTRPKKYLTPAFLGEIFEIQYYNIQRETIQQGVFYSPLSEIQFTILNVIYNHINLNLNKSFKKRNHEISSCLIAIFNGTYKKSSKNRDIIERIFQKFQNIKILDPACGSGSFLVLFQDFWLKLWQVRDNVRNKSFQFPNFVGFDVNPWSILIADFRLWMQYYSIFPDCLQTWSKKTDFICVDFIAENSKSSIVNQKYDFILGNPPYIRNRDIKNPNLYISMRNEEYRDKIRRSLQNIKFPQPMEINRFDYYIYFYLHSFEKLTPNGILGFIVSNSWMSVKFGYAFQSYICQNIKILNISENLFRSFSSAEINTIISILQKTPINHPIGLLEKNIAQFIQWKLPYTKLVVDRNLPAVFKIVNQNEAFEQEHSKLDSSEFYKIKENSFGRSFIASQQALFIGPERINQIKNQKTYLGYNWANYFFKAPQIYFELLSALGKKTVFVHDIANIRRGVTTNCNEFFILTHLQDHQYKNGYGDIFELPKDVLSPFLYSPRDLVFPEVHISDVKTFLFNSQFTKTQLKEKEMTQVLKYIRYGETKQIEVKRGAKRGDLLQGIHNLASYRKKYNKNPDSWYCFNSLSQGIPSETDIPKEKKIIIQKIFNTSYKIALIDAEIIPNNTFYELSVKIPQKFDSSLIFSMLLGSLTFLSIELQGRTNFGGGALDTATFDIGKIIILNPNQYSDEQQRKILKIANLLTQSKIQNTNIEFQKQVRRSLDEILLVPFETRTTISQLYSIILEIQNQRTQRSKTFK